MSLVNSVVYSMSFPEEEEDYAPFGVAYLNSSRSNPSLPENGKQPGKWKALQMNLRDGNFADYLANELGGRLCSQRLKDVVEANKSPDDSIAWLAAYVVSATERRPYWFLRFPKNLNILDREKTKFVGSLIIKPAFNKACMQKHNVFGLPAEKSNRIYVSSSMKAAIELEDLTGLSFSAKRLT
jgi:hypothetical protein